MKFLLDKSDQYTVFTLEEDKLDTLVAPKLKSEFVTLFQAGTKNLILDLSKVRYVDSSGLSSILVANRLSGEVEGFLVLVGLNDHVVKLLTISKLDTVLNILPTKEEAVDAIFLSVIERDLENEADGADE
ncbi:MAG: STAS domain-containing protein [Thermoflexibacteraceae bacterium]